MFRSFTRLPSMSLGLRAPVMTLPKASASYFPNLKASSVQSPNFYVRYYSLPAADVTSRVLQVVKAFEKVDANSVKDNSHFAADLGLDSLDAVELVMAFEDEFAIEIPDADADKIVSVKDAVTYILSNPNAK